jgi:hypothetical protein
MGALLKAKKGRGIPVLFRSNYQASLEAVAEATAPNCTTRHVAKVSTTG